jgi:hypothetical protein
MLKTRSRLFSVKFPLRFFAGFCKGFRIMKPEQTNGESSGHLLLYLDKLCDLAIAFGVGCLISSYVGVGITIAWIIVAIAAITRIVLYAL